MATKTFFFLNTAASGSNFGALQDGGTAPGALQTTTGWTVAKTASSNFSLIQWNATRAAATFSTTDALATPSAPNNTNATAFRSQNTLSGTFAAAAWTFSVQFQTGVGTTQQGHPNIQVWASTSPTAASATQLATEQTGSTISFSAINTTSTSTITWTPGSPVKLDNQYLFIVFEWQITTAGATNTANVLFEIGSGANILTSDFQPFSSEWFNPLSEPPAYQTEPGLSAAWTQYTSGASLPRILPGSWHQQLSEPQRRRDMPVADQPWPFTMDWKWSAPVVINDLRNFWFSPLSEPQRRRDMPSADQPWPFTTDTRTPEDPTTTFWFNWLSEPQRRRDIPVAEQPFFAIDTNWQAPPGSAFTDWYSWLSEPQRRRDMPAADQPWSFTADTRLPQNLAEAFWFGALSEPQRRRDMPVADQAPSFTIDTRTPANLAEAYWFNALSEPQRRKDIPASNQPWTFTADTRTPADPTKTFWFNWLSEPQRRRDMPTADQAPAFTADTRIPANLAEAYWFNPLSEPQRRKDIPQSNQPWDFTMDWKWTAPTTTPQLFNALSEPIQIQIGLDAPWTQFATGVFSPTVNNLQNFWFAPLSEPQRRKDIPQSNQPWDFTMDWKWSAPLTTPIGFYSALSEPIQIEPGLSAAWTQYTGGASLPVILANSWHQALAEPVRSKPDIPYRDPFTMDAKWSAPGVVDLQKFWFSPLSDPIQIETGLGAQHMQVSAVGPGTAADLQLFWLEWLSDPVRRADTPQLRPWDFSWNPNTPPSVTDLRNFWFNPLAEPVRRRDMPTADEPWPFTTDYSHPTPQADSWHQSLAEPQRNKLSVPWQQFFAIDWSHPIPQADSWHMQLAEPRWQRVLPAAENPYFITDYSHPTPQADSWHMPLAEPQRRRDMPVADQPWPFTMDWKWIAPITLTTFWFNPLSDPIQIQVGLDAPWTQFTTGVFAQPFPAFQIPSWYNFLSEPVRRKPELIAGAQQFFTMDWKWTAPTPVTFKYSFALVEILDKGVFTFFEGAVAAGAKVGIEELRVGTSANVGISEIIAP